ncbi:RAD protein [Plasmodium ovale curtisi]|nr:RAD protein [Plasmodium ovale curtisi]SBS87679.1 RAD protein [Plasmodium ovale curtisi]
MTILFFCNHSHAKNTSRPPYDAVTGFRMNKKYYSRQLSEESSNEKKTNSKIESTECIGCAVNVREKIKNFPFEFDSSELSKQLTEAEILELLKSYGETISQENVYLIFFHTCSLQRKNYNDTMESLWKHFTKLAKRYGIPDAHRHNCWWECNNELLRELMDAHHFDNVDFYNYMKENSYNNELFTKFIEEKIKASKDLIEQKKGKWAKMLTDMIKKSPLREEKVTEQVSKK